MDKKYLQGYESLVEVSKEDYIKSWAHNDFEVGQTMDPDDFNEFRHIAEDDGYLVDEDDFSYYFSCVDEAREEFNMDEEED